MKRLLILLLLVAFIPAVPAASRAKTPKGPEAVAEKESGLDFVNLTGSAASMQAECFHSDRAMLSPSPTAITIPARDTSIRPSSIFMEAGCKGLPKSPLSG